MTVTSTVLPVANAIKSAGVAMDGSASSTQFYALKLMTLDKEQQAAAMSALKLSAEQRTQIANMQQCIAAAQKYTIQELAEKAASDKATASTLARNMAKATEKRTTEQLTAAMMSEILNSNKLTAAQKQAILTSLEQATANEVQAFSWKSVAANAKAAMAAMATNPMTWVTLAITLITGLVQVWQNYKQSVEEARQAAIDAGASASALSDEIVDLTTEYLALSEAVKTDDSAKENLLSTQDALIDKLGIEKGRIEELTAEYGNLTDAIKAAAAESLRNAERDLRGAYNAQKEQLLSDSKPSGMAGSSMSHITATWDSGSSDINRKGLQALVDAGYISNGSFGRLGMELLLPDDGDFDLATVEGVLNAYDRLGEMLDIVADSGGVNIPYGTHLENQDGFLMLNGEPVCAATSQNGLDYFAQNDDGQWEERGKLTTEILSVLTKRDKAYQTRWNKVWEDATCERYRRKEHDDFWLWNPDFYTAPIADLRHIRELIKL